MAQATVYARLLNIFCYILAIAVGMKRALEKAMHRVEQHSDQDSSGLE